MGNMGKVMEDLKPALMMIMVQVGNAGVSILCTVVSHDEDAGLSILIAYRFLFASIFMLPLAFFVERKSKPKITGKVLLQAFMCGIFGGSLQQNLFVEAVSLAGATYATAAMFNLIPGATFVLAVCFGLEKMNIGRLSGKAKVGGTVMGIGGAMMLTFYKSNEIHLRSTHFNIIKHVAPQKGSTTQVWGIALAFGTCLSYSLWLIIQAKMSEKFPWAYTSAALMSVMAAIQSVIFALFMERDWTRWKLRWDTFLLTAFYMGIVASGLAWVLITCVVRQKGPLYTSIFNPLFLVVVVIASYFILDEKLHLGSLMGSILIITGLYAVLWGKGEEFKTKTADQNVAEAEDSVELGDSLQITTPNNDHQGTNKTVNHEGESDQTTTKPVGFTATLFSFFTSNPMIRKQ
ncbi:WAT1-related protein At1g25270-like [Prosopis cineraria]|uniref:WAT1-related protein At1g25270-like n=1 Tax=Prosopis cineraria TaxID=364024 RepID=UPI00240FA847|nr:WAT1-related protein At1g25270-like [Prosopis cineraria]